MKKIIAIFCIFAFLYGEEKEGGLKSIDGTNAPTTESKQGENSGEFLKGWGKFVKVGIGPAVLSPQVYRDKFFGFSTSAGIIMYPQEDFQHLFSIDFDYISYSNWYAKSIYADPQTLAYIKTDGSGFAITLNYGTSYKLFSSGDWDIRIITAFGAGIENASLSMSIGSLKNTVDVTGFIIRPNITLRSMMAEHHAFDFTIKYDFLVATKVETSFFPNNWYFYFSYAFLSF